jgi:hypothetical protein
MNQLVNNKKWLYGLLLLTAFSLMGCQPNVSSDPVDVNSLSDTGNCGTKSQVSQTPSAQESATADQMADLAFAAAPTDLEVSCKLASEALSVDPTNQKALLVARISQSIDHLDGIAYQLYDYANRNNISHKMVPATADSSPFVKRLWRPTLKTIQSFDEVQDIFLRLAQFSKNLRLFLENTDFNFQVKVLSSISLSKQLNLTSAQLKKLYQECRIEKATGSATLAGCDEFKNLIAVSSQGYQNFAAAEKLALIMGLEGYELMMIFYSTYNLNLAIEFLINPNHQSIAMQQGSDLNQKTMAALVADPVFGNARAGNRGADMIPLIKKIHSDYIQKRTLEYERGRPNCIEKGLTDLQCREYYEIAGKAFEGLKMFTSNQYVNFSTKVNDVNRAYSVNYLNMFKLQSTVKNFMPISYDNCGSVTEMYDGTIGSIFATDINPDIAAYGPSCAK